MDDQGLSGQGLDKPASLEEGRGGPEDEVEKDEGGVVVDGANGAKDKHKFADELGVPVFRFLDVFRINVVGGNGELGEIIEKVV